MIGIQQTASGSQRFTMPTFEAFSGKGPIPEDHPLQRTLAFATVSLDRRPVKATVHLDITHARAADLRVFLDTPEGYGLILHDRKGRAINGIQEYDVPLSVVNEFNGNWKLRVQDVQAGHGGEIRGASLHFALEQAFAIDLHMTGLTPSQQHVFNQAATELERVIIGARGEDTWLVTINASGTDIDGTGGVLGMAGPRRVSARNLLTLEGVAEFDTADLADLEQQGILLPTIKHEFLHILGIGTLWSLHSLIDGFSYRGAQALREYRALTGQADPSVPLETSGGQGTAGGHWSESHFDLELMTGWIDQRNPLSRMTIASLADMGWLVDMDAADAYTLGMTALHRFTGAKRRPCRGMLAPEPEIV